MGWAAVTSAVTLIDSKRHSRAIGMGWRRTGRGRLSSGARKQTLKLALRRDAGRKGLGSWEPSGW